MAGNPRSPGFPDWITDVCLQLDLRPPSAFLAGQTLSLHMVLHGTKRESLDNSNSGDSCEPQGLEYSTRLDLQSTLQREEKKKRPLLPSNVPPCGSKAWE